MTQIVNDTISRILNLLKIDPSDYVIVYGGIKVPLKEDKDTLNKISSILSVVDLGITWDTIFGFDITEDNLRRLFRMITISDVDMDKFSEVSILDDEELSLLIKLKWGIKW